MYEDIRAGDKRLESFFTFFNLRNARFEIFWTNCTYIHMCVRIYPTYLERFDAILEIQEGSLTGCASGANQQVL